MGRYTGPVERLSRREGVELFLKGERALNGKSALERRGPAPPGQHGARRGRRPSIYGLQLREKQRAKRYYGVRERQFRRYVQTASRRREGRMGEELLALLETRLDNVVYRGGLARSRDQARQLVRHSHVTVNGRKVNIPSYQVKPGDVVQVKERMRDNLNVHESIQLQLGRPQPGWLELNAGEARLTVISLPTRDQVEVPLQEQLIVEHYSK
jgi:small subunit ribosomal protein S4